MAYEIRELLASPSTYTEGRGGCDPEYVAIHYTATQASAYDNCRYFAGGNRNSSAHYFIDGSGTVWRSVPDADTAWAVGNFPMNQRSISIEVVSDGRDFTEEEIAELRWLVQRLRAQYGIPAENVIRHYDAVDFARRAGLGGSWVDPHKSCPAPYVDHDRWHNLVWLRVAPDGVQEAPAEPVPSPEPSEPATDGDFHGGRYICQVDGLRIRTAPSLSGAIVPGVTYDRGEEVTLDDWYAIADGWVWGRYTGESSGEYRYVAVGKATGKPESDDYLVKA